MLAASGNLSALANLSGNWIDRARRGQSNREIVLDMDSSVSPTHGDQESSVWNGHFGCTCYHPLFVFNQFGDLERCALRPGNVHSADDWESMLKPVIERYQSKGTRISFRGDAAFATPSVYDYLESQGIDYAIRLPANQILQGQIAHLLKRPVGRPSHTVRRLYSTFRYQAGSWAKPRRVVAKVEWHLGELFPRVGFIITNTARRSRNVVGFYNQRGTAEQHIKEGKGAIKWTRLSCRTFTVNAARLQLHALAYNLGNFSSYARNAVCDPGLDAHEPAREADQDRSQDRSPRTLRHVPNGRGGNPAQHLHGTFAEDRHPTLAAGSGANMRHASVIVAMPNDGRIAPK
jgi:hypothetical protein